MTQNVSPSENRDTFDFPIGNSRQAQISCASVGFAFPEKMATLLNTARLLPEVTRGTRHLPAVEIPVKVRRASRATTDSRRARSLATKRP